MKKYYSISPIHNPGGIGGGFFSNYRIVLEKLIHYQNLFEEYVPYVNWANTTFVEGFNPIIEGGYVVGGDIPQDNKNNPFNSWFDQEDPYNLGIKPENIIQSPISRTMLIDHSKHYFDDPEFLKKQQMVDRLYLKPKKYILDEVLNIYQKEFEGHVVLGIMARGSEYNFWHGDIYGQFSIQDYINKIKEILKTYPQITKLFIVSDESEYVEKIKSCFPNSYFVPNVFRRTDESDEYIQMVPCWMNLSNKRLNHKFLLGKETIIQAKLLAKCDILFGRKCGVLAGAVLWGEKIKNVITL